MAPSSLICASDRLRCVVGYMCITGAPCKGYKVKAYESEGGRGHHSIPITVY